MAAVVEALEEGVVGWIMAITLVILILLVMILDDGGHDGKWDDPDDDWFEEKEGR